MKKAPVILRDEPAQKLTDAWTLHLLRFPVNHFPSNGTLRPCVGPSLSRPARRAGVAAIEGVASMLMWIALARELRISLQRYRFTLTESKVINQVLLDSLECLSDFADYRSKSHLALLVGSCREELDNALGELAPRTGTGGVMVNAEGKSILVTKASGLHRIRCQIQTDSSFWNAPELISADAYREARKGILRSEDERQREWDLVGAHFQETLLGENLRAELDRLGTSFHRVTENPTVVEKQGGGEQRMSGRVSESPTPRAEITAPAVSEVPTVPRLNRSDRSSNQSIDQIDGWKEERNRLREVLFDFLPPHESEPGQARLWERQIRDNSIPLTKHLLELMRAVATWKKDLPKDRRGASLWQRVKNDPSFNSTTAGIKDFPYTHELLQAYERLKPRTDITPISTRGESPQREKLSEEQCAKSIAAMKDAIG